MKTVTRALCITLALTLSLPVLSKAADTKILGTCTATKSIVLKSKTKARGSQAINQVVQFALEQDVYVQNNIARLDAIYLSMTAQEACPPMGCSSTPVAQRDYDKPLNAPLEVYAQFKANDAHKLDLALKVSRNEWAKLNYDYSKNVGTYEVRYSASEFGGIFAKKYLDEHLKLEFKDCTFEGPIELDPTYL